MTGITDTNKYFFAPVLCFLIITQSTCSAASDKNEIYDIPAPDQTVTSPVVDQFTPYLQSSPVKPYTPIGVAGPQYKERLDVKADNVRTIFREGDPQNTIAEGNVQVTFRNALVEASHAEVDHVSGDILFSGDVVLTYGMQRVHGKELSLNYRSGKWRVEESGTTFEPQHYEGYLEAPIFISGKVIEGTSDDQITIEGAAVEACELDKPYKDLVARSITIIPDDKIIFRSVTVFVAGLRTFTIPHLVVPIRDIYRNPSIVPRFGQSTEEGFFVKTAYSYLARPDQTGLLFLDAMTTKGVGYGFKHNYLYPGGDLTAEMYKLRDNNIDRDTLTGKFTYNQSIGSAKLNLTRDFRSHSYTYSPETTTIIDRLALVSGSGGNSTSLNVSSTENKSFRNSKTVTANLSHKQNVWRNVRWHSNFDYQSYTSDGPTSARLTSRTKVVGNEDKFDWSISAQKLTDLTDESFIGGGRFAGIEKTPELVFESDTSRLGDVLPFKMPARMKFSYGGYTEYPAGTRLDRTFLSMDTPVRRHNFWSWLFSAGAGFKQYIYSDDTAQYSLDSSAELSHKLGNKSLFAFTYRYQRPEGYTPFRFDYTGRYNVLNARLDVQETERLKLSMLSGYNFEQSRYPWQNLTFRCSYIPFDELLIYTATGYDFNRARLRTIVNQFRYRSGEDFKFDLGTRYDTSTGLLARANGQLDMKIDSKTRLQALAGWNGISEKFDYQSFLLTREIDCWEFSLGWVTREGFYNDNGLVFNIRLKAFPEFTSFGTGEFGQSLDTSVGNVY